MAINEETLYQHIGRHLKARRRKQRLNQDELARRVGVTRTSIANIETGTQRLPLHLLYRICEVLEIEVTAVLPSVDTVMITERSQVVELGDIQKAMPPKTATFVRDFLEQVDNDENP